MAKINFFNEDIAFHLSNKTLIRTWIAQVITDHNKYLKSINYIFCSDDFLLSINKKYLNHNTYTDIITFNQSGSPDYIESDIYISIARVQENANRLKISFTNELHRVMIHGVLHLLGLKDKGKNEKIEMRKSEDHYLVLLAQL